MNKSINRFLQGKMEGLGSFSNLGLLSSGLRFTDDVKKNNDNDTNIEPLPQITLMENKKQNFNSFKVYQSVIYYM